MAHLPDDVAKFRESCQTFQNWPLNLINEDLYQPLLRAAHEVLDAADKRLFTTTEEPIIYFRDYNETTRKFIKHKICRDPDVPRDINPDAKLKAYLGDETEIDPQSLQIVGNVITKQDPLCRFVFFVSGHSRKELMVTRSMFKRLMTYHQVNYSYVDYVTIFGLGERPRDLRFGGFSEQTSISTSRPAGFLSAARRSGREFQMCYNLKAPARLDDGLWSVRQAAIHHQFDVENGRTLWIMTKGDDELKQNVERLTGVHGVAADRNYSDTKASFRSSLAVHLMLALWSSQRWRGYIEAFENLVEDRTAAAVLAPRDPGNPRRVYRPQDLQDAQYNQDKMKEAAIVMKLNIEVLTNLLKFYDDLLEHPDSPLQLQEYRRSFDGFSQHIQKLIKSQSLHISRAELMSEVIEDRKALIIQHMQAQNTENMSRLAVYAGADAIAMRIITVVTLLYLPATFVSTFFSTDVVKYQPDDDSNPTAAPTQDNTSFSLLALERWLEVTLPLTLMTLLAAVYFYNRAMKTRHLNEKLKLPF